MVGGMARVLVKVAAVEVPLTYVEEVLLSKIEIWKQEEKEEKEEDKEERRT